MADAPKSYRDPFYADLAATTEKQLGLPAGMLASIITHGERSNADQVSSAGARTVAQIIPATRKAALEKYGIDAYLSPQNALEVAGRLLKDSLDRNKGDEESAVREYHGGTDRANWGKVNDAYWQRVSAGMSEAKGGALGNDFAAWMAQNPATPETPAAAAPAKDKLGSDFAAWIGGGAEIPGQTPETLALSGGPARPQAPTTEPTLADQALGALEAGATTLTGATGGALGMTGGLVGGVAKSILDGTFGTKEAADLTERYMAEGANALTYQPRTATGQQYAENVGQVMQQVLPVAAIAPALSVPGAAAAGRAAAADAARAVPPAAAQVARTAATATRNAADSALQRLPESIRPVAREAQPTPGTLGSAGSAGTDMAAQRRALAESMGFEGDSALTRGQATRDPAQLKFEVETAKLPEEGATLRQRRVAQNERILQNFDQWIDDTGAQAPTLRATGAAVDEALVAQSRRDKTEVNVAYGRARRSPEAAAAVDQSRLVQLGEAENAISSTPVDYINSQPTGLPSTGLVDAARQYAVRLGIADMQDGQLVPRQGATIRQMEDWRQAINKATGYELTDIRQSTILKGLIDGQTEPVAGPLYRQARALRTRYAQNYENRATIAKLLNEKRGTTDRQVALEDVFDHSIMKGSLDDVRNVRRVLQRSGDQGKQAWRELQGATLRRIRDDATKGIAKDSRGNAPLNPRQLRDAIAGLDADGKLDFIFGKQGAQRLRDISDLAQEAFTVPAEAAINHSNTALTLLAAFGDIAGAATTGIPAPMATAARLTLKQIKDRKLRARIADALNDAQRGRPLGNAP